MPIINIARTDVVTAGPGQSAGNLATLMKEEGVGSVIIVEKERPVGIVTDRDLVMEVLEPREDSREVTAEAVMTETVITVQSDTGVFQTTAKMYEYGIRRVPVVDSDGLLAGVVTLDDILVLLTDELDNLTGVVESESPPY